MNDWNTASRDSPQSAVAKRSCSDGCVGRTWRSVDAFASPFDASCCMCSRSSRQMRCGISSDGMLTLLVCTSYCTVSSRVRRRVILRCVMTSLSIVSLDSRCAGNPPCGSATRTLLRKTKARRAASLCGGSTATDSGAAIAGPSRRKHKNVPSENDAVSSPKRRAMA